MADPFYTLQSNGLAVRSDTGTILTEWWTQSPTATESIGVFFQVLATVTRTEDATPTGVFDQWLSLSENQTWGINTNGDEAGGASILLQIRGTDSDEILGTATIQLGLFLAEWSFEPLYTFVYAPIDVNEADRFGWITAMARGTKDRILCNVLSTSAARAGEIFVFLRSGDRWDLEYRETGSSGTIRSFGDSVWMNNDGTRFVTTDRSGSTITVRFYTRSGTTWTLDQTLDTSLDANPGAQAPQTVLCASGDGSTVVLYATTEREIRVYKLTGSTYSLVFSVAAQLATPGNGIAISRDGLRFGTNDRDDTFIYQNDGSDNWSLLDTIVRPTVSGGTAIRSLDLNSTGKILFYRPTFGSENTEIWTFNGSIYELTASIAVTNQAANATMGAFSNAGLTAMYCAPFSSSDFDGALMTIIQSVGGSYQIVRQLKAPSEPNDGLTALMSNDGSMGICGRFNSGIRNGVQVYEATGQDESTGFLLNDNANQLNLGSTVDASRQIATILGTEPSNGALGTCYTSFTINDKAKLYVEFTPLVLINSGNSARCGFQREGLYTPLSPMGAGNQSIGISPLGTISLQGSQTSDFVTFGVGDIVGMAIDKSTGTIVIDCYLNNTFIVQKSFAGSTSIGLIPGVTLGINTEIGASWQVFASAINQNFSPPTGFVPLEEQIL